MAGEWVEVVTRLLESWEPDAVVADAENDLWADGSKVHDIDFQGRFFSSRGPLNAPPGPQRRPVYSQAGGSPAGREFAAKHSDTIIAVPLGVEAMKAYREDISNRMIANERKPDQCKVLYLIHPIVAETDAAAQAEFERRQAARHSEHQIVRALLMMSYFSGIDFSKFDLDKPLPDLSGQVNGHQSSMARFAKDSEDGKTLRQLCTEHDAVESVRLVGSPDTVASLMAEAMQEAGGDGFLIANSLDRRSVATIADGLAPVLRKRGLIRDGYAYQNLRDNLLEF
jgi:alkanesulfonate monooxygenase SsuD/methylene tetrahydromethanopterin reductase-like flavin-dependent oxidoreductase (luciferase family)